MHKSLFFVFALSLCMADFGAFAANTRGGRTSAPAANNASAAAPVAARAGARQTVKASPTAAAAQPSAAVSGNTAARAGKKQTVANIGVKTTTPAAASPMAARAGKTQKVISNSTKVTEATTNTAVSQECQNWFFGCMDSFCMVDNVNGARCQCSDRNAELQTVMEEIAKIDEESYILATEGVERIKMGEKADAVIAAAKAAGDKATGKATDTSIGTNIKASKKSYQLDLSAWKSNVFAEDDDDDVFEPLGATVDTSVINDALAKKGNELYTYSATMCLKSNMPDACKDHTKILQSMYAQKIRSDCAAFENKLKQDKVASSEKLRTAQNALRSAALESYEDKNKYNLGGCVQEYSKCMKNECGSDYSKCMLLAAEENMKGGAGNAKSRTIKGVVDIVLAGSTMTQLLAKKTICDDEVLVHCENYRAQVWDRYIEGAATEIHAAELVAEDNKRQNCIKTTAECFKNSCAASWDPNSDAANYDMCLSDPFMVYQNCKIQVEACIVATGGKANVTKEADLDGSSLWTGVKSMLAALRVDACTKELKTQIEKICGSDFAHCVGLNPGSIADLVPTDTLTACKEKNAKDPDAVYKYISEIAQGYALQINDELYTACENAAKQAMISVCGDEETCDSLQIDAIDFASLFKVKLCSGDDDASCKDSLTDFNDADILAGKVMPRIRGRLNPRNFEYNKDTGELDYTGVPGGDYTSKGDSSKVRSVLSGLNNVLQRKIDVMKSNKTVSECMNGKNVTGFSSVTDTTDANGKTVKSRTKINNNGEAQDTIYTNLLDNYIDILVYKTLSLTKDQYYQAEKNMQPQLDAATDKISTRIAQLAKSVEEEARLDKVNANECALKALAKNMATNGNACNCDKDLVDFKLPYPDVATEISERHNASGRCSDYKASATGDAKQGKICGCFQWDGFCGPTDNHFFEEGSGRNYKQAWNGLYWTDYAYNPQTNECTLTNKHYTCNRDAGSKLYCWGWNRTAEVQSTDTIKMPSAKIPEYSDAGNIGDTGTAAATSEN